MGVPRCPKASILPSTVDHHQEPDSGTVQSNKELVVKKTSLQNEPKDSVTPGWDMTFIKIDETVLKSQSVLLLTDKQLSKTSW